MERGTLAIVLAGGLLAGPEAAGEPRLKPYAAVSLEESYDSNVLNSRGDDAVTRLAPRLGFLREDQRLQLGMDYRLAWHTYAQNSAESTVNHRGAAFARLAIDRRYDLETQLLVIEADDPIVLERPGLAVPPGGIFEAQGVARLSTRITRRLEAQSSYGYRTTRFDLAEGPMPVAFDGDEHRADLRATWRATRRLDAGLAARGQYFDSVTDEAAVAPLAGVGLRATRKTRLSIDAGPVLYAPGGDREGALTYLAEAKAVWQGRRLRAALILLRELYGGTGAPQAIWSEQAAGVARWRLSRASSIRVSAGVGRQGLLPNVEADASSVAGRAELRIGLSHELRLDVFAEHRSQDAGGGLGFGDVERTLAGIRLVGVLGTTLDDLSEVP